MKLERSLTEGSRAGLRWEQRWEGEDEGLIACWERGCEKRSEDPVIAAKALAGELPVLPWKGGVERTIKSSKFGALRYLAMWQGLRGEDLSIDMTAEVELTCARTGVQVVFTPDAEKYKNQS